MDLRERLTELLELNSLDVNRFDEIYIDLKSFLKNLPKLNGKKPNDYEPELSVYHRNPKKDHLVLRLKVEHDTNIYMNL